MRFGGTVLPRLCLLVAVLATLTLLGCWDNKRIMEQVLAGGYETAAQVVGAQYQRKLPFALLLAALLAFGFVPSLLTSKITPDAEKIVNMGNAKAATVNTAAAGNATEGTR